MRAILIDPFEKRVSEIELPDVGNVNIGDIIGAVEADCEVFTDGDDPDFDEVLWRDLKGGYKHNQAFRVNNRAEPVLGKALVLGRAKMYDQEDGDFLGYYQSDAELPLETVQEKVTWVG